MKVDGSAVRMGMVVEYQSKLWLVVKHEIRTPGNLRAFNQVEMKEIKSGTKTNIRLSSSESVERVSLDSRSANYLYEADGLLHFMDNESFEQLTLPKDLLGDAGRFLQDNMTVQLEMHEGTAITARLPSKVTMTVVEADPVVKGQTASSSYKPATLENGVRILVPPFLEAGTRVVVNTEDGSYVERAKD